MKPIVRWTALVFAVLLLVVVSLPFLINVDQFKPTLESSLSAALGREVKLGALRLSILTGEVAANDLFVSDDPRFGKPAFVKAKSLRIGVELIPFLLSRQLTVTNLTLDQPEIVLVQAPSGDWNFSSLGNHAAQPASAPAPAKAALNLSVELVKVTNGRLTLGRTIGHWKPLVLEQVNLELRDFSATTAFPFSLSTNLAGGGAMKLDGKAGPINSTDAAMTPVSATLHATQLDLAGTGLNDAAPDLAGLVSIDAAGDSNGASMRLQGKLKGEKMKLTKTGTPAARSLELDFALQHDLRKHAGTISQGDIHIGRAVASLTGTYAEQGESMVVQMKLSGPNMPLGELAAMLPALGVVLPAGTQLQGGTANAMLSMEGPSDRLVSSGSLSVDGARLTGFDLPRRMASIEKLAGIKGGPDLDIQTLSADVRSTPDGLTVQNIKLMLPALGALTGGGTISPANALDFKMSATVETSGLMAAVRNTPIPFTVGGTCADPVFKPDVKAVVREELKGAEGDLGKGLLKGLMGGKKKN